MVQSPAPPPDPPPPSTWNAFVIVVIGVICTILLILSYYKILKRHCLTLGGSSMLRYRTERQLFNEANPDDPSLQFHSRGLDSSILYCLPTIQYGKKSEGETDKNNKDCAVCLGEFEDGDWLRFLPNCTHSFHIACIDTWFESHSNCPLCRSHIIYNLADHRDYSVSMLTLLETLRREDVIRETAGSSQVVHFESSRIMAAQQSPN
ncbi:hypothetical protein AQUCO_01000687v1 [Aquilegia coerulea]|uniref:RING-type E3 ubiquitin transferase n=1 Tax=Aquilegia coerulea TaxID=218851 RepID=A0A2G5EB69_AQUCA|nr:hypothetical protein AQUCO_01000687v1 [Aquilegia coerulea]